MVKAIVDGRTIAESDQAIVVENNYYFPPDSVDTSLFTDSKTSTVCPWKGTAAYYDASVDGKPIQDIAWYYPEPKEKAKNIKGYVAFYKNKVRIEA